MKSTHLKIGISILLIIFGIALMVWPSFVYGIATYILGAGLILNGLILIYDYIQTSKSVKERPYTIVGAIAFILTGLAMLIIPVNWIQLALGLVIAIGLLLMSIGTVSRAILERSHSDSWIIRLLVGMILFLGSVIVFSRINQAGDALAFVIGGVAIYVGISNLLGTVLIKTKTKKDSNHIDIDFSKK